MADHHNIDYPFMFFKLDIKRWLPETGSEQRRRMDTCYVLPLINGLASYNLDDIILVVPDSLYMGWCESPPFFCTSSETTQDAITTLFNPKQLLPSHPLERRMAPKSPPIIYIPRTPINLHEVYMYNFVGVINDLTEDNLLKSSQAMLHRIHYIFPSPKITGRTWEDPISLR